MSNASEKANTANEGESNCHPSLYGDPWLFLCGLGQIIPLSGIGWACIGCGFFWGAILLVGR